MKLKGTFTPSPFRTKHREKDLPCGVTYRLDNRTYVAAACNRRTVVINEAGISTHTHSDIQRSTQEVEIVDWPKWCQVQPNMKRPTWRQILDRQNDRAILIFDNQPCGTVGERSNFDARALDTVPVSRFDGYFLPYGCLES